MRPIVPYDSSKEDLIDRYLCEFDKNPIICTDPIERTSYLGISYTRHNRHKGFFASFTKEYKDYLQEFVQNNQSSPESLEYVETTLTWLLNKFKNALRQFETSPLRQEWRMEWLMSRRDDEDESDEDTEKKTEEKTENEAEEASDEVFVGELTLIEITNDYEPYHFFLRISKTQILYLKDLNDFITDLLIPIKITNKAISPFKKVTGKIESENVYVFRLTKDVAKEAGEILSILYSGLKKHGYINCSAHEFKKLFINHTNTKPLKSPPPIIWRCEHYNHLAYFVKCLTSNKIVTSTKFPSNYKIALKLFCDRDHSNSYHPSKERYDGNLNPKDQAKIDSIIEESLNN